MALKPFAVPTDLLKTFKNEVRFVPHVLPANGWIIFDRAMLISVLTEGDAKARQELARHMEGLGKAGGELVIIQREG
jgi:hypothetical protein